MCGIYLITNTVTHKVYVGQSVDIERRWKEHKARAFNPNSNNYDTPLARSIRKYGIEAFVESILCECTQEELNEKEAYYIHQFNSLVPNGYNILDGSRQPYYATAPQICKKCGKKISSQTEHQLCRECYVKSTRLVERPNAQDLVQLLLKYRGNFTAVAKLFGLTDNAIRKWCKNYGLPYHSSDYK